MRVAVFDTGLSERVRSQFRHLEECLNWTNDDDEVCFPFWFSEAISIVFHSGIADC